MVEIQRSRQFRKGIASAVAILLVFVGTGSPSIAGGYPWKSVIAGGGGFVPGIVYHPTARGLIYARTDIGGAYRWESTAGTWKPLTDTMTRNNSSDMGILSIAVDRNDTDRVYMECGEYTQSWAGDGAFLSSTDKGDTWTITPLPFKVGGNEDGRGTGERLQVDPNLGSILFMGTTANGLWRSTDRGESWAGVSSFPQTNINFVLFDPSSSTMGNATLRIFVAAVNTSGQSFYRSDDSGSTWTAITGQPSGVMAIRAAVADTMLYITFANYQGPNGATSGSVWRYGMGSGSWTNITPASGSFGFSGVSSYPSNPNIVVVSTLDRWWPQDDVYLSTNAGASWSARLTTGKLDASYAPYAGGVTPHWLAACAMDPFDSSRVMFGTGYGIWATDNLTATSPTWHFRDQNLEETVPLQIISPPFTNLLSALGDYDGFRHDNLDVSPPNRYSPARGTTRSIAFAGQVPSRIVKTYDASPYGSYSSDGGATWRDFASRPSGTTAGGNKVIAISADAGTIVWSPAGAAMSYSTNSGKSWSVCGGGVPTVPPVADRVDPNLFYAYDGASGRMWVSTDGGKSFAKGVTGLPIVSSSQSEDGNAEPVPGVAGDVWICCGSGGLYHSTTSGASASKIGSATAAYRIGFGRSSTAGGYPTIYLCGIVNGALGLYRFDDGGSSWTRINDDGHQFGYVHQVIGDPRVYGRCYVSAEGRGILYGQPEGGDTTDNPSTFRFVAAVGDSLRNSTQSIPVAWSRAHDARSNALTYSLRVFGPGVDTTVTTADTSAVIIAGPFQPVSTYVLTGTVSNGVDTTASSNSISFVTASTLTAVQGPATSSPGAFSLSQNYPNPFNPKTVISGQWTADSEVRLVVYDLLGREIAVLANGRYPAGRYTFTFDATNLSSGVYLYRLTAGAHSAVRKMLVLR